MRTPVPTGTLDLDGIDGCVFDLDGVLTDTASLHERAWKSVFSEVFEAHSEGRAINEFTTEDYHRLVDGESREDGVRHVVADRRLELPEGSVLDRPGTATIAAIAALKDSRYLELLEREGPHPFATSVALLERLRQAGVDVAVVSASRHCAEVLDAGKLAHLVDVRVDGQVAAIMDLPSKPDPALFLEAARRLGSQPARIAAFEDALAGVEAARKGGFAPVVGVNRSDQAAGLKEHGADVVVDDLGQLEVVGSGPSERVTCLQYEDPDPSEEGIVETLCTLANGYVGVRGARPWASDDGTSYPGSYVAGLFDRLQTSVADECIEIESLVNIPNWLALDMRSADAGSWLNDPDTAITQHRIRLDLETGLLVRRCNVEDAQGRRTRLVERRLVSMASPHLMAVELSVVPLNWSGRLELMSGINGNVAADETLEDRLLSHHHLDLVDQGADGHEGLWLRVRTVQSQVVVALAARCGFSEPPHQPECTDAGSTGFPAGRFTLAVEAGGRVTMEKIVAVVTSKDAAISEPGQAARELVGAAGNFSQMVSAHQLAWKQLWRRARMALKDGRNSSGAMFLHLFHLLQVASPHIADLDVGLGARGLHGEGYRGHVFWDTLFVFPVLNYRLPAVARSLINYRLRRLPAARRAAAAAGHPGAMYPWQSGSDGRDETPRVLYNPRSGRWMADRSHIERHVGLAIAFEAWQHWQVSGDLGFLAGPAAEISLEVARFFADLVVWDAGLRRYRIPGVMGPDEFHDGYPWSDEPGVVDNAYTNVMTAWLLWRANEMVSLLVTEGLTETLERLGIEEAELHRWEAISRRLHVPFHEGVISQFADYERLEEIDLDAYRKRYGDIGRMDLILEAEGDAVGRYQVAKQPDVLMLFYLLSAEELRAVFGRMGYALEPETIRQTVEYYAARVTHGSTLSRVVHSWVLSRADRQASWRYFQDSLAVDIADTRGGTTREGIHIGAMGGSIDLLQRCYTGLEARGETLWLNPVMPPELNGLSMGLLFRDRRVALEIDQSRLRVEIQRERVSPLTVMVRGEPVLVYPGRHAEVGLR